MNTDTEFTSLSPAPYEKNHIPHSSGILVRTTSWFKINIVYHIDSIKDKNHMIISTDRNKSI